MAGAARWSESRVRTPGLTFVSAPNENGGDIRALAERIVNFDEKFDMTALISFTKAMNSQSLSEDEKKQLEKLFEKLFEAASKGRADYQSVLEFYEAFLDFVDSANTPTPKDHHTNEARRTDRDRKHVERWKSRKKKETIADVLGFEIATLAGSHSSWEYKDGPNAICTKKLPKSMTDVILELEVESIEALKGATWLSPETTILGEACISIWLHAFKTDNLTEQNSVLIPINKMLAIRGRKQHPHGGYELKEKADISDRLLKLNAIKGKGKYLSSRGRIALSGQFYNVTVAADIGYDENEIPFAVLFRPGDSVFDYYKTVTHLAPYYEKLATLNVNRSAAHSMAYLIGRYLTYQWCIRESWDTLDQPFMVETIIQRAGIEKESDKANYDRFVGYFDKAFEILGEIGFLPKDKDGLYLDYLKNEKGRCLLIYSATTKIKAKTGSLADGSRPGYLGAFGSNPRLNQGIAPGEKWKRSLGTLPWKRKSRDDESLQKTRLLNLKPDRQHSPPTILLTRKPSFLSVLSPALAKFETLASPSSQPPPMCD